VEWGFGTVPAWRLRSAAPLELATFETQEPIPCVALADAEAMQLATADTTAAPWEPLGTGRLGRVPLSELEPLVSELCWRPGGDDGGVFDVASRAPPPPRDAAAIATPASALAETRLVSLASIGYILLSGPECLPAEENARRRADNDARLGRQPARAVSQASGAPDAASAVGGG
jgi:hypothetical protein